MTRKELQAINRTMRQSADEFLAIHAACDLMGVPRTHAGEKLSAAQRVQWAAEMFAPKRKEDAWREFY